MFRFFYFVEEFGLTALHYAAWNGHVGCIEVLCTNDIGRDRTGQQQSCINLKSCKGYTALHLAASEGVNGGLTLRFAEVKFHDLILFQKARGQPGRVRESYG